MFKYLLLSLITLNLYAADSWESRVSKLLPQPLSEFSNKKITLKEVEAKLGKANLVEGQKYYWIQDGLKYAIELTFTKQHELTKLNYTFTGKRPSVEVIQGIKIEELKPLVSKGKPSERYLVLENKKTKLVIDPVSKTLYSVSAQ